MAMYDQFVDQKQQSLRSRGIEVPTDAEFVRFVELNEWGTAQARCMQDQGFDSRPTVDGGGVLHGDVPSDQMDAHWQATYRCRIAYPVHPRFHLPLTDEQIRVIYDYFVNELVACLEDEGYEVAPAPSWETFRSQWDHPGGPGWWEPHDSVQPPSREEDMRIMEKCPQRPPLVDVYGEPDHD
jgi:hypothetical protein